MGTFTKSWWGQALHNKLIALVLAMIVIVPLVATPADNSVRGIAALAFEGLSILLMAVLLWRVKWNVSRESVSAFFKTGINLPVTLFLMLASVSALLSPFKGYALQELLRLGAGGLLYFAVAYQFRRSEQLAKLTDTLLFVTLGASLLGFAQYSGTQAIHSTGLFGDHQLFGSFLMLLLPIMAVLAITERAPNRQIVAQAATVCAATCLLLTQARSAWIGAALGLVTLGALALWRQSKTTTRARRHEVIVPIMLLFVACGFFLLLWPQTANLAQRFSTLKNVESVSTMKIRQQSWTAAEQMMAAHPFTGVGLGQFPVVQKNYTHEGMPLAQIGGRASLTEQAHNYYLQTAAEMGYPGLILLLSILVVFWVQGARRVSRMDTGIRRSLLMGSLAASVAFAADAFASPSWQFGQVSMFLWLNLGLGVACMRSPARQHDEEVETLPVLALRFTRPATVLGALAFATLLPTIVFATGNLYAAPLSAAIRPKSLVIRSGQTATYSLFVTFSDGSTRDVTLATGQSQTNFTETGAGFLSGPNNRIYNSLPTEKDILTVTGTYTQTADPAFPGQVSGSVSDTGNLRVR